MNNVDIFHFANEMKYFHWQNELCPLAKGHLLPENHFLAANDILQMNYSHWENDKKKESEGVCINDPEWDPEMDTGMDPEMDPKMDPEIIQIRKKAAQDPSWKWSGTGTGKKRPPGRSRDPQIWLPNSK